MIPQGLEKRVVWEAATDDVTDAVGISYVVYRSGSPGGQDYDSPLAVTPPGRTYFIDGEAGGPFYYVVRARDGSGNLDSNTAEVSTEDYAGPVSFAATLVPVFQLSCSISS